MKYRDHLPQIEALVRETFSLWDERRVGFSWRHYFLNHTLRVRALALALGERESADPDVTAFAATLHDITKRYDGAICLDADGKRLVDEDGCWRNETLPPARQNRVTRRYEALGLAGQVHHRSGAALAEWLLAEEGLPEAFRRAVADAILAHVRGSGPLSPAAEALYRAPEARVLYDADLMDANLGLVAFYRNIQIYAGRAMQQGRVDPREYLAGIERWVGTKDAFLNNLLTPTGREVAAARQARNRQTAAWLAEEEEQGELAWRYGTRAVVAFLLQDYEDPSLSLRLAALENEWLPARQAEPEAGSEPAAALLARAAHCISLLRDETEGRR